MFFKHQTVYQINRLKMKKVLLSVLVFLILVSCSVSLTYKERFLQATTYVTTPDRGPTVKTHCSNSLNRQSLYNDYGLNGDIPFAGSITYLFDFDTSFIDAALAGKWDDFGNKLKGSAGKLFIFVGAWVIGLGVALLLWPFLLCCCICPWSCPTCNRKRQNMPYTNCEMLWPAIVSLILLLIILATSIVGIASRFKAQKNYTELACASGVLLDDVINGNVSFTDSTTYFTGVRTIDTQLRYMNSRITVLNSEIAKLGSSTSGMTDAKNKISTAKSSTGQIPSTSQATLTLNYPTPLQSTPGSTTSNIPSTFPQILGTKSANQSLVGVAYTSLTFYQDFLKLIGSAADAYTSNIGFFTSAINKALNETNRFATQLEQQDSKVNDFWKSNEKAFKGISIGQYVYYGLLIGFTALMIIAVSCTVFATSQKCRYFMYTLCVILFLLCLIAFAFCVFVGILNPALFYSCQFVQQNLASQTKLASTLVSALNIDPLLASIAANCIAVSGTANILKDVVGDNVYNTIESLNQTYISLINIDTALVSYINLTHSAVLQNVTAYKKAQIKDITDQTALDQLIKLSKASSYSCNSNGFTSDSWIPSISQAPSYVPCQISGGSNSDSSTCTSSINFNTRAQGCTGCMDTYDLFKANSTYTNVNAALSARYSNPSCATFNSQLSNVWGNFYKTKLDVLGPVQSRAQTAKTNADSAISTVNYFAQVKNNILGNFSTIVDSQFGLLKGINCQVTSQDIYLMKNVVCQGLFLYTIFTRVIFGIISFALLLLMCCITCTGHRNAKQMEFNARTDPYDKKQPEFQNNNMPSEQQFVYNKPANPYLAPYYQQPNQNPYAAPSQYANYP